MNNSFQINDKVIVTDNGWTHTTWDDKAVELGATKYVNNYLPDDGMRGRIVAIDMEARSDGLYLVDFGKTQALIGGNGLQLITKGGEQTMQKDTQFKKGMIYKIENEEAPGSAGCSNLKDDINAGIAFYVRLIEDVAEEEKYVGQTEYEVLDKNFQPAENGGYRWKTNGHGCCSLIKKFLVPVSPARNVMTNEVTLNPIIEANMSADIKVLMKAGILDTCGNVQDSAFVLTFLVNKFSADLAQEAKKSLEPVENKKAK